MGGKSKAFLFRNERTLRWLALAGGPILALVVYAELPEAYTTGSGAMAEFAPAGRKTAAIACWMAVWWMTEAIPLPATALLPLALFPLTGVTGMRDAAAPYAHELIFLFMGGFILALSMQRWGLDRRTAFTVLRFAGTRPAAIVGGMMAVTAFLSMWVSNTATTITMLPIALSVIGLVNPGGKTGSAESRSGLAEQSQPGDPVPGASPDAGEAFALCLLLGIAYSASIGGIGTLIGTPPNLFLASYARDQLGLEISFAAWMAVGLPLVAVFLPLCWWLLTYRLFPLRTVRLRGMKTLTMEAHKRLGPVKRGEWITMGVFTATAAAWMTRPLLTKIHIGSHAPLSGLTDAGIAILAAISLFVLPTNVKRFEFTMDWSTAVKLPWGLLILFGGGLSLASAVQETGVGEFLGNQVGAFASLPGPVFVLLVTGMVIFLTEITSNTATAATLLPVLSAVALGLGRNPLELAVPAAVAASCAFMLPVATPPNAIVFGSGHVPIRTMIRAGMRLNLAGVLLITALTYALVLPVFPGPAR